MRLEPLFLIRMRTAFLRGPVWIREPASVTKLTKYYRSAGIMLFLWCTAWYDRMLSRPARLLLIVFLITSFFSGISVRSPALVLFFFMAACAAGDFLIGLFFLPRLSVERNVPDRASCGSPFTVRFLLANKRKHISALDLLAEPYTAGKELLRPDGLEFFSIAPGEMKQIDVRFTPVRRGYCVLPCAMVESSFPFNIFKHAARTGDRETVLVHPFHKTLRLPDSDPGESVKRRSFSSIPLPGESLDFHGCRDYQYGDSIRKIHWLASAKHNSLIVKEFQQEQQARAVIITDLWVPSPFSRLCSFRAISRELTKDIFSDENPELEGVLSLAASTADTLANAGYHISRFFLGSDTRVFTSIGDAKNAVPEILDALACAKPEHSDALPAITSSLEQNLNDLENVYVFLLRFDENAKRLRMLLDGARIRSCFRVVSTLPMGNLPPGVRHMPPADILSGKADAL